MWGKDDMQFIRPYIHTLWNRSLFMERDLRESRQVPSTEEKLNESAAQNRCVCRLAAAMRLLLLADSARSHISWGISNKQHRDAATVALVLYHFHHHFIYSLYTRSHRIFPREPKRRVFSVCDGCWFIVPVRNRMVLLAALYPKGTAQAKRVGKWVVP